MAQEMVPGYCMNCRANKMFVQNVTPPNHAMHFLLTLLLCGCWAWIWLAMALGGPSRSQPICSECGLPLGYDPARFQRDELQEMLIAQAAALREGERKEKARLAKASRSIAWEARKERFNAWISGLEQEQRIAMIAAPGFVMLALGGLGLLLWSFYR